MTPLLSLVEVGARLLEKIIPDPEARARAQMELMRLQQDGQFRELEARMSAINTEAASNDPWTSRARPSFLYVMYAMILGSIPMGITFVLSPETATGMIEGVKLWLDAIPGELYALFGAGYLGYAHYRTVDKKIGKGP